MMKTILICGASLLSASLVFAQEKPAEPPHDMEHMQHGGSADSSGAQKTRFMQGNMHHSVAQGVKLDPNFDVATHTIKLRIGPMNLPAHTSHMKMPQPPDLVWDAPLNGWLLAYHPKLVDASGNAVPGTVLHHVAFWNENRADFLCPNKEEHIFGAGSEMTDWAEIPGYGYRVQKGDKIRIETMMYNPTATSYDKTFLEVVGRSRRVIHHRLDADFVALLHAITVSGNFRPVGHFTAGAENMFLFVGAKKIRTIFVPEGHVMQHRSRNGIAAGVHEFRMIREQPAVQWSIPNEIRRLRHFHVRGVRRQIHGTNSELDGMGGHVEIRIELDALSNRVVHVSLHEARLLRSGRICGTTMLHVLHIMRWFCRFFLGQDETCAQQTRSANQNCFHHRTSPRLVFSLQAETSFIILPRSEQRNCAGVDVAWSEQEKFENRNVKWKHEKELHKES